MFYSLIYVQSNPGFFQELQNETYRNLPYIPCDQKTLIDLQFMYFMGGEI